jgi:hypothetical protein
LDVLRASGEACLLGRSDGNLASQFSPEVTQVQILTRSSRTRPGRRRRSG